VVVQSLTALAAFELVRRHAALPWAFAAWAATLVLVVVPRLPNPNAPAALLGLLVVLLAPARPRLAGGLAGASTLLRPELGREVKIRQGRLGTRNAKAWELVQKAEARTKDADALFASGDTAAARKQLAGADSLLVQASQEDRRWVAPAAQRAKLVYKDCRWAGTNKVYNDTCTTKGITLAEAAVAVDSTDPDAREARGELKYFRSLLNIETDPDRASKLVSDAEADFQAAVEANPAQASAWSTLSHLQWNKVEPGNAKLSALKAYTNDPYLANANVTLDRLFGQAVDAGDEHDAAWSDAAPPIAAASREER